MNPHRCHIPLTWRHFVQETTFKNFYNRSFCIFIRHRRGLNPCVGF